MTMSHFTVPLVLSLSLLGGCASQNFALDPKAPAPAGTDTVLIQGIPEKLVNVAFFKGALRNGVFVQKDEMTFLVGQEVNGYLVGKAQAGDVIAMTGIRYTPGHKLGPKVYDQCTGVVAVFTVPAGKVAYLGDASFEGNGHTMRIDYTVKLDAAKAFMAQHYPQVDRPVETLGFTMRKIVCPRKPVRGVTIIRY